MDIKHDLQTLMTEALDKKASSIFLKRATGTIAESPGDKESLAAAAERVGRMVALFIDEELAKKLLWEMMSVIHESGSGGRSPKGRVVETADERCDGE
ncbi:MAG: hypothetical protein P8Z71_09905 [Candidatus Sulfobium sp.]|jgi:hypothetical protein